MSVQSVSQEVIGPMEQALSRDLDASNDAQPPSKGDEDFESGSNKGRQQFSSHLRPLQLQKTRSSVNWAEKAERPEEGPVTGTTPKVPTTPYYPNLSPESEKTLTSKINELSQLDSPLLRELAKRLGQMYKIETPSFKKSSKGGGRNPFTDITVGERWQEIQGNNHWENLLDPIDSVLRAEIIRYGEFAQACYDAFDGDKDSKYCGSSKFTKVELLEKVGLENRGYKITQFLYATSELNLPNFFTRSMLADSWSKNSNWIGFVAVCTSPQEIARLGRRDIVVAWRGTITKFEWIEDLQDYLAPAGFDPRHGDADVMVESGFLSVYKSSNAMSRYNKTSAREQVLEAVRDLVEEYKHEGPLSITVTGHSLGSALATLCGYDISESKMNLLSSTSPGVPKEWNSQKSSWKAFNEHQVDSDSTAGSQSKGTADGQQEKKSAQHGGLKSSLQEAPSTTWDNRFRSDRIPITVYSYAGPRVGNRAFRKKVEELGVAVLRVANRHDIVTKVPGKLFPHMMELLEPVIPHLPAYKHVGIKLKVDFLQSTFLEKNTGPAHSHNLEAYLHVVDGFQGTGLPFQPTLREYTLVNKGIDFLKPEYGIPAHWWQEANKGLVKDNQGHWVLPERDAEIFPKTPVQIQENTNRQYADFWSSVAIAAQKSSKNLGGGQGPALVAAVEQGGQGPALVVAVEQGGQGPALIAAVEQGGQGPALVAAVEQGGQGPALVAAVEQGGQGPALVAAVEQGQLAVVDGTGKIARDSC